MANAIISDRMGLVMTRIWAGQRRAALTLEIAAAKEASQTRQQINLAMRERIPGYRIEVENRFYRRLNMHADRSYFRDLRAGLIAFDEVSTFTPAMLDSLKGRTAAQAA